MKILNQERPIKKTTGLPYINVSSYNSKKEKDEFLSKGSKYTFSKDINLKEVIPKIERVLKLISQEKSARIRNLTQNEISKQEKLGKKSNIQEKKY